MSAEPRPLEVPLADLRRGTPRPLAPLPPEEQARADLYALAARLLLAPPDAALLAELGGADALPSEQADHPLDRAWERLVAAAGVLDEAAVADEFDRLFVSIGMPAVNPYGSLYQSGFMMEKPLAALRDDLAALGLARRPGSGELEDHLAALCETMRLLIAGAPGLPRRPLAVQKDFFDRHLAPWYERCLDDLRQAEGANFYRRVADFMHAFLDVEAEAFDIDEDEDDAGGAPPPGAEQREETRR
ncbi:TorD/DmsD family molecular chaperone [Caldimonas tepidiphila]|uniref:TorD/DmsD family molecular chaperone n=1 Tax=Caldimonas tepidiphila TaxID=2315841 RepID=UPI000E5BCE06|nr:molecular chaperone TorD family protein [Caldimonas tepidiphila]